MWLEEPLGTLCIPRKGKNTDVVDEIRDGYLPYLGAGQIAGDPIDKYASVDGAVVCKDTDVLILWDGERSGLVGYGQSGIVSSTAAKLVVNERIDSQYLYYFLSGQFEWIQNQRTGTGVPHVPKDLTKKLFVKYPQSEHAQKKIAKILKVADVAIENTRALIAKYENIKQGMMQDLFTRGVDENGQLRRSFDEAPHLYQETELGWLPIEWSVNELSSCTDSEITYGIVQAGPHIENGVPYIRTGDMSGDEIIKENLLCTSPEIASSYRRSEVNYGDVVCAIRATVGKVLPVSKNLNGANLTQGTAKISPNSETNEHFLLWVMRSDSVKRQYDEVVKGTTFMEITLGQLRKLVIPYPEKKEQIVIGQKLEAVEFKIRSEKLLLDKLKKEKFGLMQDLLTGKVRVAAAIEEREDALA